MRKLLVVLLSLFIPAIVCAATLTPIETKIRDRVIAARADQISFLKKLVNINSGSENVSGVGKVGKIVAKQFKKLGFTTRFVKEPAKMKRAATLIAERQGTQGQRILLIGHLDTVFSKDSPFQKYQLKDENIARGPGVIDDKGGIVTLLYALKALSAVHALDHTSITVVLTGDEEDSGKPTSISRKPLIAVAKKCDVALDFEPTITLETSTIARRGVSSWTIESHGNESHSATIFQKNVGDGAIFELSRILNSMRTELQGEKDLVFNPAIVLAGNKITFDKQTSHGTTFGKDNVVAKIAMARGDYRFVNSQQEQSFKDRLSKIVSTHLQETHSTVIFEEGIPAMAATENNLKLLEKYSTTSVDLGFGVVKPLEPGIRGAGDISFVAGTVPANLAGLGPSGLGTHTILESLDIKSLPIQTQRAALLIYRLTRTLSARPLSPRKIFGHSTS